MKNFKRSKAKTPEYLLDEGFVFVFSQQSFSVASAECLKSVKIWKMKNFIRSKAKTSKTKNLEYLFDESFVFVFSQQSISVASAECLKSVKNLKNKEFLKVEN